MLSLTLNCSGGNELKTSSDLCEGAHLIYLDKNRKDMEFTISNNEFACEECKSYLSNEEQEICDL